MTGHEEVERLLAVITVDCYNLAEQVTAFYEAFAEEVPLPTTATVVGTTIKVVGVGIAEHGEELTARCHRRVVVQDLHLSDLGLAPDTPAGWIDAAYRRCLGLVLHPAAVPEGWSRPGCEPSTRDYRWECSMRSTANESGTRA